MQRARMRLLMAHVEDEYVPAFGAFFLGGAPASALLDALAALQARLAPDASGPYALGAWSLADVALAPLVLRLPVILEHELGRYPLGEGKRALAALREARFARLMKYIGDVRARPSVLKTYYEVRLGRNPGSDVM